MTYPCPHCGKKLDMSTGIGKEESDDLLDESLTPKPGDMSVCAYCSEVNTFDDEMQLRVATAEEIVEANLVEIARAQRVARLFRETMGGGK